MFNRSQGPGHRPPGPQLCTGWHSANDSLVYLIDSKKNVSGSKEKVSYYLLNHFQPFLISTDVVGTNTHNMSGLVKAKKYDWKDSNLALFGSDTEKKVRTVL